MVDEHTVVCVFHFCQFFSFNTVNVNIVLDRVTCILESALFGCHTININRKTDWFDRFFYFYFKILILCKMFFLIVSSIFLHTMLWVNISNMGIFLANLPYKIINDGGWNHRVDMKKTKINWKNRFDKFQQ